MAVVYKAGVFEMPTSPGSHFVRTGFRPKGVTFFGIDTATVDSVVSSSTPGMFMGQMGQSYDDHDTLTSYALSLVGNTLTKSQTNVCIVMSDGSCNTQYQASPGSFSGNGFTINVTAGAPGTRYIHWWAFGGTDDAASYLARAPDDNPPANTTLDLGFKFRSASSLLYHPDNTEVICRNPGMFYGTTHWPLDAAPAYARTGMSATNNFGIGQQGYLENWVFSSLATDPDAGAYVTVLDAAGPFVNRGFRLAWPSGTTSVGLGGGGSSFFQHSMFWEGEGWTSFITPGEDVGGTATASNGNPNFNSLALVEFSHINGVNATGEFSGDGRFGYGVMTKHHQSCVSVHGTGGKMYQSLTKAAAIVDAVGLLETEAEISGNAVTLTTLSDSTTSRAMVAHMYGPPAGGWVPQVYRRRIS